jgi:transcription antitermination factor NusG
VKLGDELPPAPQAVLQRGACEPVWFAFQTPPLAEVRAQAWLGARGVEAWYPTEVAWRRLARGPRRRVKYLRTVVPRYVFARFVGQPQWAALRECRWLSRVVGLEGRPLPISERTMAQMAAVPRRLEELRRREIEARTIRAGDRALVRSGPLAGWVVEVTEVHGGIARFVVPLLGAAAAGISVEHLHKTQGIAP